MSPNAVLWTPAGAWIQLRLPTGYYRTVYAGRDLEKVRGVCTRYGLRLHFLDGRDPSAFRPSSAVQAANTSVDHAEINGNGL